MHHVATRAETGDLGRKARRHHMRGERERRGPRWGDSVDGPPRQPHDSRRVLGGIRKSGRAGEFCILPALCAVPGATNHDLLLRAHIVPASLASSLASDSSPVLYSKEVEEHFIPCKGGCRLSGL